MNASDEEHRFLDSSWLYNKRLQAVVADNPTYDPTEFDYNYNFDYDSGARYLTEEQLVEKKLELFLENQQFQVGYNSYNFVIRRGML